MNALDTTKNFTIENLPDLDVVVLAALEALEEGESLPETTVPFHRPLIIGSGNAQATGKILFRNNDAVFADETSYQSALDKYENIDGIVLISASGGKHSVEIAKEIQKIDIPAVVFTNNKLGDALGYFDQANTRVFPKNREPYTYNTSPYLNMIISDTGESAKEIAEFIEKEFAEVDTEIFTKYEAFTFILPPEFTELKTMLRTKFEELFGTKVNGRFFTTEEIKHAKTVVPSKKELFINIGGENNLWGDRQDRLSISLVEGGGYAAALATTYYLVGLIQKAKPPYFKENIEAYCQKISEVFGQDIKPIVG